MLYRLGRGLSAVQNSTPFVLTSKTLSLLNAIPAELIYARNDAVATYRDVNGKLQQAVINEPRCDHDINGVTQGVHIEGARTNKCTNTNASPVNTNDLTISAGTPVISVVSDTTALTTAGLDEIGNGQVYMIDNSSQGTSASIDISGSCGNTNAHSFSVWARMGSGNGDLRRTGSGSGITVISGSEYGRYLLENETPSSTSNVLRLRLNPGAVMYFLLNQLEEGEFTTSEIIVSGAAATREQDILTLSGLDTKDYYSDQQGFITARYYLERSIDGEDQYLFVASDGTSANTFGLRLDSVSKSLRGYVRSGSVNKHTVANGDNHIVGHVHSAGLTWQSGETTILSGGIVNTQSYSGDPSGIDTIEIGRLSGSIGVFFGHMREIRIGKTTLTPSALGARMISTGDSIVMGGGQSLMSGYFDSQESSSEDGKQTFRQILGDIRPGHAVVFAEGAIGSSAASKTTQATNFWWDLATSTRGDAFDTFYNNLTNNGVIPNAVIWSQGEQDSLQIGLATSRAEYKAALEGIFADMRATLGDIPIFIQIIGHRSAFTNTGGVQAIREVQQEIITENSWCHFIAESYDQTLFDSTHLDDTGYVIMGERLARGLAAYEGESVDGVVGPQISGVSRGGTTVTVTVTHDGGTDFTPTSGIEGFKFFDDSTEIAINSAVRTDANTITLTLNTAPSGVETLYYIYDAAVGVNTANLVKDNAEVSMPLRSKKVVL